jgi:hypothetical protein
MPTSDKKRPSRKSGYLPNELPAQAIKMTNFIESVIETTQLTFPLPFPVKCFRSRCKGEISSEYSPNGKDIYWKCSICRNTGTIAGWQGRDNVK